MHRIHYLFILIFFPFFAIAQHADRIVPLATNPVLTELAKKKATERITPPPPVIKILNLPFLDDFSKSSPVPDTALWINGGVFTNYTYPIWPRTLGVATFDGVNGAGMPYDPTAPLNASYPADTLTSQFIGLAKYTPADSIYLSFWWQVGGYGSLPKLNDSLILEFSDGFTWKEMWYHLGYTPDTSTVEASDSGFHFVAIPVKDPQYFINGFQFRFRSYACTAGNLDHWNIDIVYLDWLRSYGYTDTVMKDIAFCDESPPLLNKYRAMPWEQFTPSDIRVAKDTIIERNNYNATLNSIMYDTITGPTASGYHAGNFNFIQSPEDTGRNHYARAAYVPVNFTYTPLTGPTSWNITYILSTTGDFDLWNDTLRYNQVLYDYYAYDDGTAEAGYSIINVNTPPTMLATQITLNHPDSLLGLQLFFNYVVSDASSYIFRLAVWNDDGGQPGSNPVYEAGRLYNPIYDSLNHFAYFKLDTPQALSGTVYIGFIQTFGDTINIGYDWNDNHQYQTFYNAGYGWNWSSFTGTPMMRPVFGHKSINGVYNTVDTRQPFTLYPNPARDEVMLGTEQVNSTLRIYASDGRLCYENERFSGKSINTSQLSDGFYIVELTPRDSKPQYQKLLISR